MPLRCALANRPSSTIPPDLKSELRKDVSSSFEIGTPIAKTTESEHADMKWLPLRGQTTLRRRRSIFYGRNGEE